MKLEEEIKQKEFKNEFQKLAVNIIYTNSWLTNLQSKTFSRFDITGTQYNILRILRGQHPNPASINLLKERMLENKCDASRLVERLRVKGLVNRKISKVDRRRADVVISDAGLDLLKSIDNVEREFNVAFKHISKDEAKTVNTLLDKMRGNNSKQK
ncbi:MAG: winged helix-turn-helix transcriptional regulator [Ignavibacteriae bacterium]|nr:MarR family transcriptional regulator [Ignavibacteriota bacterium]NOG99228.1 winged helix-turn-helix transcriptional regulator [Ignavibacteriota bacterium]